MISQKTVTIKDDVYMITQLPASKGIRVLKQLGKLIGPALPAYREAGMSGAIGVLFDNIDSVDVEALIRELATTATKGSVAINYDMEFAGQYDKLFMLVQEVVEFNFGSVFTMLGSEETLP